MAVGSGANDIRGFNMTNKWRVEIIKNENGELILPFPTDLLNQVGWHEGTELLWIEENDTFILKENANGTKTGTT